MTVDGPDLGSEEAAVRAVWDELGAAFVAQDWDRYSALWIQSPGLQVVHPDVPEWISGWSAFEPKYKKLVQAGGGWTFRVNRLDVTVAPDGLTAWSVGEVVMTFADQTQTTWQMAVYRKVGTQWRVAAYYSAARKASQPEVGPD